MIKKIYATDAEAAFVPKGLGPCSKDPYYFRNQQAPKKKYYALTHEQVARLERNGNWAEDWNQVLVAKDFNPALVRNTQFWGMVRIGNLEKVFLEHHELRLMVGIYSCAISDCDIGDNVVLRNVHHISHYIIGNTCILFNIDEMTVSNHAKFGVGILKDGEKEKVRVKLEICNENGNRAVLPFIGMLPADAYLWSRYRDDSRLMRKFQRFTEATLDKRRGYYGTIGEQTVIKSTRIIKDICVGSFAYIKGANKLKNITILSSLDERAQIGEGVELVNGIIGYGSHIFYGSKCVRFQTGRNVQIKYGARVINSVIGANSTVSCCEILNNLIFPFHEQHHNSSFLIAATVLGQSNIAAAATIGSNHNSRAPDGEIIAGRGFWPGLSTSFKYNCRFASFTLIASGNYSFEMNIPFPFSLIGYDASEKILSVLPGYWFLYNMYAIVRNEWKFGNRDKRKIKDQHIETCYLAPDTVEEMFDALDIMAPALRKNNKHTVGYEIDEESAPESIFLEGCCGSNIMLKVSNPCRSVDIYKKMILYYCIRNITDYLLELPAKQRELGSKSKLPPPIRQTDWRNLGGQIVMEKDFQKILSDIKSGKIDSWDILHKNYDRLWKFYPNHKLRHALGSLERLLNKKISTISKTKWNALLKETIAIQDMIVEAVKASREKDFTNPFRKALFESTREKTSVLEKMEDTPFIRYLQKDSKTFKQNLRKLIRNS